MRHQNPRRQIALVTIESFEPRILLSGTPQTITITVPENQGVTFSGGPDQHVDVDFKDCTGTVTVTGTDLMQNTVSGGGIVVTGMVTAINQVVVTGSSNPGGADVLVDGKGFGADEADWEDLQDIVDDVRVDKIDVTGVAVTGTVQIYQANSLAIDFAHEARMTVLKSLTAASFGTIVNSSFTTPYPMSSVNALSYYGTGPDLSQFIAPSVIKMLIEKDSSYTAYQIGQGGRNLFLGTLNHTEVNFLALPNSIFNAGDMTDSTLNITGGSASTLNMTLGRVTDSFISYPGYLRSWNLTSMINSSSGSGGFTGGTVGSIQVRGNYQSDFTITPNLSSKFSVNSFKIGGVGSGDWNVRGTTNSLFAHSFDSGFNATFGRINTFDVGATYSGKLYSGSVGSASMSNFTNGSMWFTSPYSSSALDLGTLKVQHEISGANIFSSGNIGSISTMFTYNSWIQAGMGTGFTFGHMPLPTDFASPAYIANFYSDCPNKTTDHFAGSDIDAFDLRNVQIGNILTQTSRPEGFAATSIDKLRAAIKNATTGKSGVIDLSNIKSAADVTKALSAAGIAPSELGDLQFLLPQ